MRPSSASSRSSASRSKTSARSPSSASSRNRLLSGINLIRRQERLDFLYESGLAVGKGSSDGTFCIISVKEERSKSKIRGKRDQEGQEKDRTRGDREGFLEDEMALKFLNKKGWHTGSLRNIENVWKAKQKHEAEQCKLEELRKQIQDEREKSEFASAPPGTGQALSR
ncbi:hypothetical protein C4D60_Mb01t33400 [Musa balbisiana]|uniref:CBF1-interacting co-repressor CIR N-terminal domain-containing protein n=1 Tax=Musa balbisiana TaxID=52838 RepID=A0A4S8JSL1_MUSBA|nr:hypothetical protein C4D60_Mb01t33400 [Musa balbisiana]